MKLKTIQYISAKNKALHKYLREQGLNDYSHIFFLDQYDNYYMLAIPGIVYKFIPYGEIFFMLEIEDKSILTSLLCVARDAIEKNQKCLRSAYDTILDCLKMRKIIIG